MDRRYYLLLLLSMLLVILPEVRSEAAEGQSPLRFEKLFSEANPCQSGLEVSDYRKLRILVEDLPADTGVPHLAKSMLQTKCETRLKQAGIEPASYKEEYLSVKVEFVREAYAMTIRLVRPVLFKANDIVYRDPGARTWRRQIVGLHKGNTRYIFEGLDSLLDDFIADYLKANSR